MGKWDHLVGTYPTLMEDEDSNRQEKINKLKEAILLEDETPEGLVRRYHEKRAELDLIDLQRSGVNMLVDAYEQLIVDKFQRTGHHRIVLADGIDVSTQPSPYPKVKDPEEFRLWCLEEGLEKSLKLHPSTTSALVKKRLEDGLAPPPGITLYIGWQVKRNS
jgi:hypothetical protein